MTDRDWARVTIHDGNREAILAVLEYTEDEWPDVEMVGEDDTIIVNDVNWLPVNEMVAADPDATWVAMVGPGAEHGSMCVVYRDRTLHYGAHVDGDPVIPVAIDPDSRERVAAFAAAVQALP